MQGTEKTYGPTSPLIDKVDWKRQGTEKNCVPNSPVIDKVNWTRRRCPKLYKIPTRSQCKPATLEVRGAPTKSTEKNEGSQQTLESQQNHEEVIAPSTQCPSTAMISEIVGFSPWTIQSMSSQEWYSNTTTTTIRGGRAFAVGNRRGRFGFKEPSVMDWLHLSGVEVMVMCMLIDWFLLVFR